MIRIVGTVDNPHWETGTGTARYEALLSDETWRALTLRRYWMVERGLTGRAK